jgi:hypothetical protein
MQGNNSNKKPRTISDVTDFGDLKNYLGDEKKALEAKTPLFAFILGIGLLLAMTAIFFFPFSPVVLLIALGSVAVTGLPLAINSDKIAILEIVLDKETPKDLINELYKYRKITQQEKIELETRCTVRDIETRSHIQEKVKIQTKLDQLLKKSMRNRFKLTGLKCKI